MGLDIPIRPEEPPFVQELPDETIEIDFEQDHVTVILSQDELRAVIAAGLGILCKSLPSPRSEPGVRRIDCQP